MTVFDELEVDAKLFLIIRHFEMNVNYEPILMDLYYLKMGNVKFKKI
jgi:hypothetical protein